MQKNSFITLRDEVTLSCELRAAISRADVVIISIPSQSLRGLMGEMRDAGWQGGKYVVDKFAVATHDVYTNDKEAVAPASKVGVTTGSKAPVADPGVSGPTVETVSGPTIEVQTEKKSGPTVDKVSGPTVD